jgi:DNA modification methylase
MSDLISKLRNGSSDSYGNGVVMHGDCVSLMKSIPDGSIQACVSDPPWGVDYVARREKFSEIEIANDKIADYKILMDSFASELFRIIKKNGSVYIFSGGGVLKMLDGPDKSKILHWNTWFTMDAFFKAGFIPSRILFWDKISPGMSYRYRGVFEFILYFVKSATSKFTGDGEYKYDHIQLDDKSEVFRYPRLHGANKVHTAEKPVRLYESFILDSSDPGDLIIDPFAGSGPIIDACKNTGRRYIAMELNKDYIEGPDGMLDRAKQVSMFERLPVGQEPERPIQEVKGSCQKKTKAKTKEPEQVDIEKVQDLRSELEEAENLKSVESDMDDVRDLFSAEEGNSDDENMDRDDILDKE